MRFLARLATVIVAAAPLWGCGSLGPFEEMYTGSVAPASAPVSEGQVYLFRGFIGGVFSRGMDAFAEKIKQRGVNATVASFADWPAMADEWIARHGKDPVPPPLILIGHSIGGTASVQFARRLKTAGMPVNLVVAFDPARMPVSVPSNVERFINLYQSNSVMGAGDIEPASDFHGAFASVNLKEHSEIIHVTIDKSDVLQDAVLSKIVEVVNMPASPQAAPVAIKYAPPAGAPIELWDGGAMVAADEGQTVSGVAAKFGVPSWAVASINGLDPQAPLQPGQNVIVPRHLTAGAVRPVASYAPERR
jgi:pimeloyl-ACP methyl ester carboxylesterase